MARSSEDVLLIINDIRHKKTNGALYLMGERMAWMQENKDSFSASHFYADIKMQKISPDSKDKVQLQVVLHDGGANTFQFGNPLGRDAQKKDRDAIKELLQQLLPKFRRKISSELEEKNRLLREDPELFQLYKDLVVSQIITAEEFWQNRSSKLSTASSSKSDDRKQDVGVSAAFLADIKPETDGCNGVNYNLTADIIESIFRTYPMVKKKHADNVPYKMTESEFWTNFFQSHYFHRDRINLASKDMFSECARKDEEVIQEEISKNIHDPLIDLTQFKDKSLDEGFGRVGEDSKSSNNLANLSLIRRFNHHSTMVLKACETRAKQRELQAIEANGPSGSKTDNSANSATSYSAVNNNKSAGKIPNNNGLSHLTVNSGCSNSSVASTSQGPLSKKARIQEKVQIDDLAGSEGKTVSSTSLRLTKMERYLHGPTQVTASTYTASEDVVHASQVVAQEITHWHPRLHQSVTGKSALCVLGELSPGGALMSITSQHQLQQMVPENIQEEIRQLYNALCELLRHFWSCFPTSSKFLEEKVVKMRSTLERFERAKLQSFKEHHSHYNINLTGHIDAMLQAAYFKFDAWQTRRQARR